MSSRRSSLSEKFETGSVRSGKNGSAKVHSSFPNAEQDAAVVVLKEYSEETVLALLRLLRSVEPGFYWRTDASFGGLDVRQLEALTVLAESEEEEVMACLRYHRLPGNIERRRTLFGLRAGSSRKSSTSSLRTPPAKPIARSSISSPRTSWNSTSISASRINTPRTSWTHSTHLPDVPEPIQENEPHGHWCTYGEHNRMILSCDGWKRHQKEHEDAFACMPRGPMESTPDGLRTCAICGEGEPDDVHLAGHAVYACVGLPGKPLTLSRRTNMIKHLTSAHGVMPEEASSLADRWRYKANKRALSCGFCVKCFANRTDQLNHIDREHFAQGQKMDEWRLDNVIRGLLMQDGVREAWRFLIAANPGVVESGLRWEMSNAEGLQLRLEVGDEASEDLAAAAFALSSYDDAGKWDVLAGLSVPAAAGMDVGTFDSSAQSLGYMVPSSARSSGYDSTNSIYLEESVPLMPQSLNWTEWPERNSFDPTALPPRSSSLADRLGLPAGSNELSIPLDYVQHGQSPPGDTLTVIAQNNAPGNDRSHEQVENAAIDVHRHGNIGIHQVTDATPSQVEGSPQNPPSSTTSSIKDPTLPQRSDSSMLEVNDLSGPHANTVELPSSVRHQSYGHGDCEQRSLPTPPLQQGESRSGSPMDFGFDYI